MAADIFDRSARRRARARSARAFEPFLAQAIRDELDGRADMLPLDMTAALFIGAGALEPGSLPPRAVVLDAAPALLRGFLHAVAADEDRLPFADNGFTAIVAAGTLHAVNDLPGFLVQCRRILRPGGRLLGGFVGGAALGSVRAAFARAEDAARGAVSPRVGPTVDPAQLAGLLQRAGLADPVVDVSPLRARYSSLARLAADARAMGETGFLTARARAPVTRGQWAAAEAEFAKLADADGRVPVEAGLVTFAARAP